jgi:type II secretory pathway component PulF
MNWMQWLAFDEWLVVLRRWNARRHFKKLRPIVYEGIDNILNGPPGATKPLWSTVFKDWALRAQRRNLQGHASLYRAIANRLFSGMPLSQALQPYVPIEDVLIIEAGERSGDLKTAFKSLLKSYAASREIDESTSGAFRAPLGSLLGFIMVSFIMGLSFWPQMIGAVPAKYWDTWALAMVYFQIGLAEHWWALFLVVGVFWLYNYSKEHWIGALRRNVDTWSFLPYSTYRDQVAAKFLIVLSGLLKGRLLLDKAMEIIGQRGSLYLRWHTRQMRQRKLLYPEDAARALNSGLFSDELLDRISNATAVAKLDEALREIGDSAIDSVVRIVKRRAIIASVMLYSLIGLLFIYYTAAMVVGFQLASDRMLHENKDKALTSLATPSAPSVKQVSPSRSLQPSVPSTST